MDTQHNFHQFWGSITLHRLIFTIGWRFFLLLYFGIGAGALTVIFLLETQLFLSLTGQPDVAYGIAGLIEAAKIGATVMTQALIIARRVAKIKVSAALRAATALFQGAIGAVSLGCSLIVLIRLLDSAYYTIANFAVFWEDFGLRIAPAICIGGMALTLSLLLHGLVYIVFGHLLAAQMPEFEHLFSVRFQRLDAKKNSTPPN